MDWIGEFESESSIEKIHEALDAVINNDEDFIDDYDAPGALAAAEVVAALNAKPSDLLHEEVAEWVRRQHPADAALRAKAAQAVSLVFEKSELREIWEEDDQLPQWQEAIDDLLSRLK